MEVFLITNLSLPPPPPPPTHTSRLPTLQSLGCIPNPGRCFIFPEYKGMPPTNTASPFPVSSCLPLLRNSLSPPTPPLFLSSAESNDVGNESGIVFQTAHLCTGFIGDPAGHANTSANTGFCETTPFERNGSGACTSRLSRYEA